MKNINSLLIALSIAILSGCTSTPKHINSSVVDYLYSDEIQISRQENNTALELPLKVGIAFTPTLSNAAETKLTETDKSELLEQIADNFRSYDFVNKIEVIPSAYLKVKGGFANLNQISKMYDIDVIALVSYDQVQFTDEGALSMTYLTIVGAYIFSGEKNDTSTMLDTTIYDIKSRKLLFRAPGSSKVKGSATLINQSEALRADSSKGFKLATTDMITNLQSTLARFREKLKNNKSNIKLIH